MLASQLGASMLLIATTDLGVALIAVAALLVVNGPAVELFVDRLVRLPLNDRVIFAALA